MAKAMLAAANNSVIGMAFQTTSEPSVMGSRKIRIPLMTSPRNTEAAKNADIFPYITFSSFLIGLVQRESNPHRFLQADFRPDFVIALVKPERLHCGQCLVRAKIRSVKTALHI